MSVLRTPDDPVRDADVAAWKFLEEWEKPALMCFSDGDPIPGDSYKIFLERVPGSRNQPYIRLRGGHFVQNSDGPRWAQAVVHWAAG